MYLTANGIGVYWQIVDTDFIVIVDGNKSLWEGIIIEYEKRNLDVAKNLIRAMRLWTLYDHVSLYNYIIRYTNGIEPYIEELEKYMVLL